MKLEKQPSKVGEEYKKFDFYEEKISRMETQTLKNLDELTDSDVLLT
jgi:hypothetical protein